ncbi:MAG: hypothetical protein HY731_00290, partial [Candidatus Tectomicrobia bacterium]|nr:hypothetical protein [Candidatus Tectomicrobia bacterium]
EVIYALEEDKEGSGLQLIRQVRSTGSSKSLPNWVVLSHQVKELRFRYRGDNSWHDQWEEKNPPLAIELSVIFQDRRATTIPLMLSSLVSVGPR